MRFGAGALAEARMRLAAHLGISDPSAPLLKDAAGSVDPVAQIACAAAYGFAGIADNRLQWRDADVQRRMGKALRDHGMQMGSFTHHMPGMQPPVFWGAAIADMDSAMAGSLSVAERVGGGCINLILLDSGAPAADQWRRATDNLGAAALQCGRHGVSLAIEHVSRARVPHILSEDLEAIASLARTTGVGLILDSCHCYCAGEDMAAAILSHRDILSGVQIADMPGRVPPGVGVIGFAPIMQALVSIDWQGLVEAEFMPHQQGTEAEISAIRAFRKIANCRT